MNPSAFLESAFCARLVLTFAHFLWQGVIVLLLVMPAAWILGRASANARYGLFVGALLVMAACPPMTFLLIRAPGGDDEPFRQEALASAIAHTPSPGTWNGDRARISTTSAVLPSATGIDAADQAIVQPPAAASTTEDPATRHALWQWGVGYGQKLQPYAGHAMLAYLLGASVMFARLVLALCGGKRLARRSSPVSDAPILTALARQAQVLGLRFTPAIAYCRNVCVPTVVGVLRPMILLPFSLASGLTPGQIEALLAHELAHIRRYDHLVNLFQRLVEAVLFFHPAVWLLSSRIRLEREHCCDDLVLAAGSPPVAYAESLVRMAELSIAASTRHRGLAVLAAHRMHAGAAPATLAATGHYSQLRTRILRLIGSPGPERIRLRRTWPFALTVLAGVVLAGAFLAPLAPSETALAATDVQASQVAESPGPQGQGTSEELAEAGLDETQRLAESEIRGRAYREAIRLTGITPNGLASSASRAWWRPDGSPLEDRPLRYVGIWSNLPNPFEFVIEMPAEVDYGLRVVPQDGQRATEVIMPFGPHEESTANLRGFVLTDFSDDDREATFTLEIAGGQWQKVTSFEGYDWTSDVSTRYTSAAGLVFTSPRMEYRDVRVELTHTYVDENTRLIGYDRDGNTHVASDSCGGGGQGIARRIYRFPELTLETVFGFEFQQRPYDYAITFRNVSLQAGHRTQVEMEGVALDVDVPEPPPPPPIGDSVTVRLIDPEGRPVSGARIGRGAGSSSGTDKEQPWSFRGQSGWSDDDGRIIFPADSLFSERVPEDKGVALYALHEQRQLVGLREVSRGDIGKELRWVLEPACHVIGQLTSSVLQERGRELGWTNVYASWKDHRLLSFNSTQGRFEFLLPAGSYHLWAYGTDVAAVEETFEVEPGQKERRLTIDLPPTRLTQLAGHPAPELREIKGWVGGEPVTLADLRGKPVLLEFWGHWCGPCIQHMPSLMDLHDELAEKGLVIIGIHDDSLETAEELESKLAEFTENRWAGRAIPFRIALDGGGRTPIEGTERSVNGATTAAYGITGWPTTVLIDPDGKVVGKYDGHRQELERMLGLAPGYLEPETVALRRSAGTGPQPSWRARFDQVYRLEETEAVRRIAPPFIPERLDYYRNDHESQASLVARAPDYFHFSWDGQLTNAGLGFISSPVGLSTVLSFLGLRRYEYEGPDELLDLPMPGDWIVRKDASREARLRTLEEMLATQLGRQITFEARDIERQVLVASGTYRHQQLLGIASRDSGSIHLFAETIDPDDGAGGGTSDLAGFLRTVGSRLKMWVINEAHADPDLKVVWNNNDDLRWRDRSDEELAAWQDLILDNIARQTSLTFKRENRTVRVWFVREGG